MGRSQLVLFVLTGVLCVVGIATLTREIWTGLRRIYRRRRVARELVRSDLQRPPSTRPLARDGRSELAGVVPEVRPDEPWHRGAGRVLAFHERLAEEGRYVNEMSIARRLK